jgi:hypothetical protein
MQVVTVRTTSTAPDMTRHATLPPLYIMDEEHNNLHTSDVGHSTLEVILGETISKKSMQVVTFGTTPTPPDMTRHATLASIS